MKKKKLHNLFYDGFNFKNLLKPMILMDSMRFQC